MCAAGFLAISGVVVVLFAVAEAVTWPPGAPAATATAGTGASEAAPLGCPAGVAAKGWVMAAGKYRRLEMPSGSLDATRRGAKVKEGF